MDLVSLVNESLIASKTGETTTVVKVIGTDFSKALIGCSNKKFYQLASALREGTIRFVDEALQSEVVSSFNSLSASEAAEKRRKKAIEERLQKEGSEKRIVVWDSREKEKAFYLVPDFSSYLVIDCTEKGSDVPDLCPSFIGPISVPDGTEEGTRCESFEALWLFSAVRPSDVDHEGNLLASYWKNRANGFAGLSRGSKALRKEKPLYHIAYLDGAFRKLGHLEARKKVYIPTYAKLAVATEGFRRLKELYASGQKMILLDNGQSAFRDLSRNVVDFVNDPTRPLTHSLVLRMLLEGDIEVRDGEVVDNVDALA